MARIEHTIEVNVPLNAAYNQWTQFEEFPRFMEGVREVKQLDDVHLHWRAERNGHEVEWDSEIVDQVPDQHIKWRDMGESGNTGMINFYPVAEDKTRVQLVMEYAPHVDPSDASMAEVKTTQRVEQDLARFKRLLEAQGHESGAWRGEIHFSQPAISSDMSSTSNTHTSKRENTSVNITNGDRDASGQSIFAQQVSPVPPETPSPAKLDPSGSSTPDRQTKGEADPRTATLDDSIGTSGLGEQSTGGIHGMAGSRTEEASRQSSQQRDADRSDPGSAKTGSQSWLPNLLQGWEEPMVMMRKMAEEMDNLFDRFIGRPTASRASQGGVAGKWMPPIEILQHENHLHICADLPGIKKEDVHIEILHDKLSIEGERREHMRQTAQGYHRSERSYGHFYRMVPLPPSVDPDSVKASLQNGVLEIIVPLPLPSTQRGRRIDIKQDHP